MGKQFITNKEKFLSEIIKSILPKCDNAYFLVGYFYFSGFTELYTKLKDTHLKVLIGLEIEKGIFNQIKEVDSFVTSNKSRNQKKNDQYASLVEIFNDTDFFDSEEQQKAFRLFYKKIKNGSLEIHKTEEPNHAKMYLFENREEDTICGTYPGTVITGSSNLSYAGLKGRMELNAILRGKEDYTDGKEVFDKLWTTSIVIADKNNLDEFDDKVIKHIWYEKLFSPHALYLRVLHEFFSIPQNENLMTPHDITGGKFMNLMYQTDAVNMAINSIKNHNGVIISDVVGLGKSIIASTVAHNLKMKTIIVAPPHLKQQWEIYKDVFIFPATVFSNGIIEEALKHYNEVSLGTEQFLIIIDEAHKYRNENTQDYAFLHKLCSGNKVMLLTATPFNNRPADIYSMLKLFQIPSKSTLKTVENLGAEFKELIASYKQLSDDKRAMKITSEDEEREANKIAKRIRDIISPLVIRRSRLDLEEIPEYKKDLKNQHVEFPKVEDPKALEYNLGNLKDLYLETLNLISSELNENEEPVTDESFKATRYRPITHAYVRPEPELKKKLSEEIEEATGMSYNLFLGTQRNLSKFMKRLLVGRFESSIAAFRVSLDYMIYSSQQVLEWIDKRHKIPIFKKGYLPSVDSFYVTPEDNDSDESYTLIQEKLDTFKERGLFEIDMDYINDDFVHDVQKDIDILLSIKEKWEKVKTDPKLIAFRNLLQDMTKKDPKRKIVVFTQYADTANYLGKELKNEGLKIFHYTSADSSIANKEKIRLNFDAGVDAKEQKDDYRILIATDAISEGYNLHRAGTIFNYDIPYNPTRVIQRVGRINRVNKKVFDKLYIFNFFPTDIGEKETRTKEISILKMKMIHAIMGEDTKILTSDEKLNAFFKERYDKEMKKNDEQSWETPYRKYLNQFKGTPQMEEALSIPHRVKIARKKDDVPLGILMFGKKGNDFVFKYGNTFLKTEAVSSQEALSTFRAEENELAYKVSDVFDVTYQNLKEHLFKGNAADKEEKNRKEALAVIRRLLDMKILPKDYLMDLQSVIIMDALSGYELRYINSITPKTAKNLIKEIEPKYINRIVTTANNVDSGKETIIFSEEFI